jgi:hypothetical protein
MLVRLRTAYASKRVSSLRWYARTLYCFEFMIAASEEGSPTRLFLFKNSHHDPVHGRIRRLEGECSV